MNKKLTLVSVSSHGIHAAAFVELPVDERGKVHITQSQLMKIFSAQTGYHVRHGGTYSIGT